MILEELMVIHVTIEEVMDVISEDGEQVVMIRFGGNATGDLFTGEIQPGGVDTQWISKNRDTHTLSARYMLVGKDYTGDTCKLFIENNGDMHTGTETVLFRTTPKILTDSPTLSYLNKALLVGEGVYGEDGLTIRLFQVK